MLIRALAGTDRADLARAHVALAELKTIAAEAQTAPLLASAGLSAGLVALAENELDAARRDLEDAVDLFERSGAPFEVARARLELARVLERLGRTGEAAREVDRALEQVARLDARTVIAAAQGHRERLLAPSPSVTAGKPVGAAGGLTAREVEVLRLISSGLSNQAIADRLCISEHTVHRHVANTLSKLDVPSRSAAVAQAARLGLL